MLSVLAIVATARGYSPTISRPRQEFRTTAKMLLKMAWLGLQGVGIRTSVVHVGEHYV